MDDSEFFDEEEMKESDIQIRYK